MCAAKLKSGLLEKLPTEVGTGNNYGVGDQDADAQNTENNPEAEIDQARYPKLRLLQVPRGTEPTAQDAAGLAAYIASWQAK